MSLIVAAQQQLLIPTEIVYDNLYKSSGSNNSWDAGANSIESIPANTDGELFWLDDPHATRSVMVGLTNDVSTNSFLNIEFLWYQSGWSSMQVYESGVSRGEKHNPLVQGQVASIFRNGTTGEILYRIDGVTKYTSTLTSTQELFVDASIYKNNNELNNIHLEVDGVETSVTWENRVNVSSV